MWNHPEFLKSLGGEIGALRQQVTGVRGVVIAGVDGLLILQDTTPDIEPHDLAALAAGAHGISRTCATALNQDQFRECTIHNDTGYLSVYAVGDLALLAVVGDKGLNVARLHLETKQVTIRLANVLNDYANRNGT